MLGLHRGDRLGFLQFRVANLLVRTVCQGWFWQSNWACLPPRSTGHSIWFSGVLQTCFPICFNCLLNLGDYHSSMFLFLISHQPVFGWCSLQLITSQISPHLILGHLYNAATALVMWLSNHLAWNKALLNLTLKKLKAAHSISCGIDPKTFARSRKITRRPFSFFAGCSRCQMMLACSNRPEKLPIPGLKWGVYEYVDLKEENRPFHIQDTYLVGLIDGWRVLIFFILIRIFMMDTPITLDIPSIEILCNLAHHSYFWSMTVFTETNHERTSIE